MRVLRFLKRCLQALLGSGPDVSGRLDSHKWESKMEILGHLHG